MGECNSLCKICKYWQPNICFIKNSEICIDCLSKKSNSFNNFISGGDKPSAPFPQNVNAPAILDSEGIGAGQSPETSLNQPSSSHTKNPEVIKNE